MGYVAEQMKK